MAPDRDGPTGAPARRAFRPSLWLTLFAIPTFLVLVGLGVWQVERRAWKHELVADLERRAAEAPLTVLPPRLDPAGDAGLDFRRVRLAGRFLVGGDQLLVGRSFRGATGYGVFSPFELADGRILFVDRGWIPLSARDAGNWRGAAGSTTVDGVLRLARHAGAGAASLGIEHYRVDPIAMARQAGQDAGRVLPATVVLAGNGDAQTLPAAAPAAVDLTDNHLQYAVTWFTLAGALVAIYLIASFHPRRSGEPSP